MNLSVGTSTQTIQPSLPGLDVGLATFATTWTTSRDKVVHAVPDAKVDGRVFASFDEAVAGAREILVPERKEARWGLFGHKPGPVAGIALLQNDDGGVRLARTNVFVDPFKQETKGAFYPGQSTWGPYLSAAQRMETTTLALVGAKLVVDLRSGERVYAPRVS